MVNVLPSLNKPVISLLPGAVLDTLKFGLRRTGAVSSDRHNPANRNCGVVPDGFTDVVVNAGTPNPLVISGNAACHLIKVQPGATVTIATGVQLTVTGR